MRMIRGSSYDEMFTNRKAPWAIFLAPRAKSNFAWRRSLYQVWSFLFLLALETSKVWVNRGHQGTPPQPGSWGAESLMHVETRPHCSVLSAHSWLIFIFVPFWKNCVCYLPRGARKQVWFFHVCLVNTEQ